MVTAKIIDEANTVVKTVELKAMPELNEVLTLDDGLMYEVIKIENNVPMLKNVKIEEDWGQ